MKVFLSSFYFLLVSFCTAQSVKPVTAAMSFTCINNQVAPLFGIAGKYPPDQKIYVLDHYNKLMHTTTTTVSKVETDEYGSFTITMVAQAPAERIYGMNTVVVNPVEGDVRFINADTITDNAAKEDFARLMTDSNSIEKKFKATLVNDDSKEVKSTIEAETKNMLASRSFTLMRYSAAGLSVVIAKFPNAVFMRVGNKIIYTPSLVDNYIIPSFSIGSRLFIDLPGYMFADPKYPKCENWNSRIMEVLADDVVQRSFTCY